MMKDYDTQKSEVVRQKGTGLYMLRIDHLFLHEYERFDDEQAHKVIDKETEAYSQHLAEMEAEYVDENDDTESNSTNPE
eukprot:1516168-Karenia_brevis.AAC.1